MSNSEAHNFLNSTGHRTRSLSGLGAWQCLQPPGDSQSPTGDSTWLSAPREAKGDSHQAHSGTLPPSRGLSSQEETTGSPLSHDVDSLAQSTTVIASGRKGHYGALSRLATIPTLFQKAASLKATDGFVQTSNAAHGAPWQATPLHKSFYKVIQSCSVTLCPRNTRRHKTQPFHLNYPVESPPPLLELGSWNLSQRLGAMSFFWKWSCTENNEE